jgi:hypothetical protein
VHGLECLSPPLRDPDHHDPYHVRPWHHKRHGLLSWPTGPLLGNG